VNIFINLTQEKVTNHTFKKDVVHNNSAKLSTVNKFKLHSIGLVKLHGDDMTIRCNLYRQYLQIHL
jgi:AAA-like domain